MVKEHHQILVTMMAVADLAVTALVWLGCFYMRFDSGWFQMQESSPPGLQYASGTIVVSLLLTLLIFGYLGMYQPRRIQPLAGEFLDVVRACVIVWVLEVATTYFMHHPGRVSIKLQVMFLIAWPSVMVLYRGTARLALRSLRSQGRNLRTAAIIGSGRLGQTLLHTLQKQSWSGYRIEYFVDDVRIGEEFLGVPVRGPCDRVEEILADRPVDAVFVAMPAGRPHCNQDVLDRLGCSLVDINIVPDLPGFQFLRHRVQQLGPLPVVNVTHSRQTGWNAAGKRIFDLVFSLAALVAISWLLVIIAILVKLTSRGSVFYLQRRASLGGREFHIVKFRSMFVGSDGGDNGWSTARHDPRVTPVGRRLRRWNLDELPQLFNVLVGDMSIVGPRPELPEFAHRFNKQVKRYSLRHHVKSGITGWAQVNGFRGRTSLRKRIQYDLDYINRWSLGFDMWIIALTLFRGFVNHEE
jgi:Undecaprenyl-phosphate glucose phosphotransferase